MTNSADDALLEPAKAYREQYREAFLKNAQEMFNALVIKSGINADENRKVAAEYRKVAAEADSIGHRLSVRKGLRVFLIILAVIGALVGIFGIIGGSVAVAVVSFVVAVGALVLIFAVLNKKIKALSAQFSELDAKAKNLYNEAMRLIAPLLDLFDNRMTAGLVEKTVPQLTVDRNFDMRRYDYLHGKYGLPESDDSDTSMLGLLSGEIAGNPFLFERRLHHDLGWQYYTGSLTIHWVTYSRDSKGHTVAHHHTQTLHASVRKPKPFYATSLHLIYGNDAAPDLTFTHDPTHAEQMSEKELRSFVKSGIKKIRKEAQKRVEAGFTEMGNEDFDVLFGALDRDEEVQFRLMFSPLAQKNMLALMKGDSPYGDDFVFHKEKCLNYVKSEHAQTWDPDPDDSRYRSYDVDLCKKQFVETNAEYFKNLFFDLAPLLSVPLYQQYKPREYIYGTSYPRNFTVRESEIMANRLGGRALAHPASKTPAIFKTELRSREGSVDRLRVSAFSYRTVHRVDFIPRMGGDGHVHSVPVPWIQYIPLSQTTDIELRGLPMSDYDYRHSNYANDDDDHTFFHGIFATLGEIEETTDAAPEEKDMDISKYGDVIEEKIEEFAEDADNADETDEDPE